MLTELRKVIPSWVKRVDVEDRGVAHARYLECNDARMHDLAEALFGGGEPTRAAPGGDPEVTLVDWDPDAETKIVAAMLYPYTHLPEHRIQEQVASMSEEDRLAIVQAYAGDRGNRRHRPGRALERGDYRFDILSDYGAFRDLQRHRLLTVEWQDLSPAHGYTMPGAVVDAGGEARYAAAMGRSAGLYDVLVQRFSPEQAAYAVALAYRVRYVLQCNAREAMHVIELRTSPQGHPEYRKVCQQMYGLILEKAGHRAIAALMSHVDGNDYEVSGLERLEGERRAAARRAPTAP
jgi:hypothetical protein